jgi:hypothetical protein
MVLEIKHKNGCRQKIKAVNFVGILTVEKKECFYWQTYYNKKLKEHWCDKDEIERFTLKESR